MFQFSTTSFQIPCNKRQNPLAHDVEEPVLGALPEAHAVGVRVVQERGDGEHGRAAGQRELSGVEGHGVEVEERHGEVVN